MIKHPLFSQVVLYSSAWTEFLVRNVNQWNVEPLGGSNAT